MIQERPKNCEQQQQSKDWCGGHRVAQEIVGDKASLLLRRAIVHLLQYALHSTDNLPTNNGHRQLVSM